MDFAWEADDAAEELTRRLKIVAHKIRKAEREHVVAPARPAAQTG